MAGQVDREPSRISAVSTPSASRIAEVRASSRVAAAVKSPTSAQPGGIMRVRLTLTPWSRAARAAALGTSGHQSSGMQHDPVGGPAIPLTERGGGEQPFSPASRLAQAGAAPPSAASLLAVEQHVVLGSAERDEQPEVDERREPAGSSRISGGTGTEA